MFWDHPASALAFPHPLLADDDGVLAVGGDLSLDRLKLAYQFGIFPWSHPTDPHIWHCPIERSILWPAKVKVQKSMRRYFNQSLYHCTRDRCFAEVMRRCAISRGRQEEGTWITDEFVDAYTTLHEQGLAHSIEVWQDQTLVGGLYGVQIGQIFGGESMFSDARDASKFALITLCRESLATGDVELIDCQVHNPYLASMGAEIISRQEYYGLLKRYGGYAGTSAVD